MGRLARWRRLRCEGRQHKRKGETESRRRCHQPSGEPAEPEVGGPLTAMADASRPWRLASCLSLLAVLLMAIIATTAASTTTIAKTTTVQTPASVSDEATNNHVALRLIRLAGNRPGNSDTDAHWSASPVGLTSHQLVQRGTDSLSRRPKALAPDEEGALQVAAGSGKQVAEHQQQHASNNAQLAPSSRSNRSDTGSELARGEGSQRRLMELKQKYMTNRAISDTSYYILLVVYALFILVGAISNSLICLTAILKPKILSPRNIFIVNLASSDLLLCVFTMPFTYIEMSMKMWQLGTTTCKLVAGLQATSIYVSTISITAIALDRHKVIVNPTHQETADSSKSAALLLAFVWIGALLLSTPLFTVRTVQNFDQRTISTTDRFEHSIKSINFCIEKWPFEHGRGIYSVISMIFQYVVPITIVSVAYASINQKLKKRLRSRQRLTQLSQQKRQSNLINKTHSLLIYASVIFGCSWLPLNLLNVIGDFSDLFKGDDQRFRIVFAICHLVGCSSACSNPILYGYYNKNFRKEFHQVYTHHMHALSRRLRRLCCPFTQQNNSASLPPSNSSATSSTDSYLSSYNSQSNFDDEHLESDLDSNDSNNNNQDNDDHDDDDDDDELSSTSSLYRRFVVRSINSSMPAFADQNALFPSNRSVNASKPTSGLDLNNQYRADELAESGLRRAAQKRPSYAPDPIGSKSHYYSFQTLASNQTQTLAGRTVRRCWLCIRGATSSGDSSETVGQPPVGPAPPSTLLRPAQSSSSNPKRKQLNPGARCPSPVSPNPSSFNAASRTSPLQQHRQRLQSFNEPPEVLEARQRRLRLRRIRRRRRRARRYRGFVDARCECQCHSHCGLQRRADSAKPLVRRRRISQLLGNEEPSASWLRKQNFLAFNFGKRAEQQTKTGGGGAKRRSSATNLNHRVSIDDGPISQAQVRRESHTEQRLDESALHGRRVWLRFLPAIERYYNEPVQDDAIKLASKQTNNCGSARTDCLIADKVESDRCFKSELSVIAAQASCRAQSNAELSAAGEQSKRRNSGADSEPAPGRRPTLKTTATLAQTTTTARRHCADCRRVVAGEYRKLIEAARASRARKRAAKTKAANGIATQGGQQPAGSQVERKAPKEVALATSASKLFQATPSRPGTGGELGAAQESGSAAVSAVVVLNVDDLEDPAGAQATGCAPSVNNATGSRHYTNANETLTKLAESELFRKRNKRDYEDNNNNNENNNNIARDGDGNKLTLLYMQMSSPIHHSASKPVACVPPAEGNCGAGVECREGGQEQIIGTARDRDQSGVTVAPSDKPKRLSGSAPKTDESDMIDKVGSCDPANGRSCQRVESNKDDNNNNNNNSGVNKSSSAGKCSATGGKINAIEQEPEKFAPNRVGPPPATPILRAAADPQQSHASSGSSLCACLIHSRSSSCTCSVSANSNSSSSFGSNSLPDSNAACYSSSLSVATSSSSSPSSSASSSASSVSVVSGASLTGSGQVMHSNRPQAKPAQHSDRPQCGPQQAGRVQRPGSSSFSTATAPRRPDMKTSAASVLQLSAPSTCQTSATGSSCSIATSASASAQVSSASELEPPTRTTTTTSSMMVVTQSAGHFARDELQQVQPRKLSAASCGSPTGASRQLATINELSFRLAPVAASNGLPGRPNQEGHKSAARLPAVSHTGGQKSNVAGRNTEDGSGRVDASKGKQITARNGTAGRDRELVISRQEIDIAQSGVAGDDSASNCGQRAPDSTHYLV